MSIRGTDGVGAGDRRLRSKRFLWVTGPYVGLSTLAGATIAIRDALGNGYLEQNLDHLAAANAWDQVSRDASFAVLFSAILSVALVIAGHWPKVIRRLQPHIFVVQAFALYTRFVDHQAWSVTMPAFGVPLPGFLWHRQRVLVTGGLLVAAVISTILVQRFGRRWAERRDITSRGSGLPVLAFALALLLVAGARAMLWTTPAARAASPVPIIWITWDSVRADRSSAYGYDRPTTPHLEQLAADGVLFETAISQHNWTRPSYASMFVSRGAWDHPRSGIPLSQLTLAEILRAYGYETIGYVQNPNLDAEFNTAQGFASYNQLPGGLSPHVMNGHALPHLAQAAASGRPVFLFLHYQQPHYPYDLDNPFRAQFVASRTELVGWEETSLLMSGNRGAWNSQAPDASEKLRYLNECYDAAIRYADEGLGEAIAHLKALGLYDNSLIIVNSDHGEEFQERGGFGHGRANLYPELTSVPLVIRLPGKAEGRPRRVQTMVQNWDILPTILSVAGIPVPQGISGRSLLPLLQQAPAASLAFSSNRRWLALRTERYALHADFTRDDGFVFYDRDLDPAERFAKLDAEGSPAFEQMRSIARDWWSRREMTGSSAEPELSTDLRRRLRSLGYIE